MKSLTGLAVAIGLLLAGAQAVQAQTGSMQSGAMSSMAMPKCASSDPVVGVNMTTKMYMTQAQMQAKSAGMTPSQKAAMMQKNHVKLMCKSQATSMGAKAATPPTH
jgi:hypothetical protein